MTKKLMHILVAACSVALCAALVGCSSGPASSSSASEPEEFASIGIEKGIFVVGEETDTALNVVFTNETGQDITDIAVLPAGSDADPVFLMTEGEKVPATEQFSLFAEPVDGQTVFDIVIASGDVRYTLHNLDLDAIDSATIRLDGDVAYIERIIDGAPVSTLREECDLANPVEEQIDPLETSSDPVYDGASAPSYDQPIETPVAPSNQGEDSCVGDVILR